MFAFDVLMQHKHSLVGEQSKRTNIEWKKEWKYFPCYYATKEAGPLQKYTLYFVSNKHNNH